MTVWIVLAIGAHDAEIEAVFDSVEGANEYVLDGGNELPEGAFFRTIEQHEVRTCTKTVTV